MKQAPPAAALLLAATVLLLAAGLAAASRQGPGAAAPRYLALPLAQLPVHGLRPDQLYVAVCTPKGLIGVAYTVAPPPAWSRTAGPLYRGSLGRGAYLVAKLPEPPGAWPPATRCGAWSPWLALSRLHHVAVLRVQGYPYPVLVYWGEEPSPAAAPSPALLRELASRAGALSPSGLDARRLLRFLHALAASHPARLVEIRHARGWRLSLANGTVAEAPPPRGPEPALAYIDGGSSTITYSYMFAATLARNVSLDAGEPLFNQVYLGSRLAAARLVLVADSPGRSCLDASVTVELVNPVTGGYDSTFSATSRRLCFEGYLEASIPVRVSALDSRYQRISVAVRAVSGKPRILLAVVEAAKTPAVELPPVARRSVQVLSSGLGEAVGAYVGRAPWMGLEYSSVETYKVLDYGVLNGVLVDYAQPGRGGVLTVRLSVANYNPWPRSGEVRVYVNGVEAASWSLRLGPHSRRVVEARLPVERLLANLRYNAGGQLVVANTFNDPRVVIRLDAVLRYTYLPEVWDTGNPHLGCTWYQNPAPGFKMLLNVYSGGAQVGKLALVLEPVNLLRGGHVALVAEASLTRREAAETSLKGLHLSLCTPYSLVYSDYLTDVKTFDRQRSTEARFLGAASVLYKLVSTVYDLLSLLLPSSRLVDTAIAAIGTVANFAPHGPASSVSVRDVTINGTDYTCIKLDDRALGDADAARAYIELQGLRTLGGLPGGAVTLYVAAGFEEPALPSAAETRLIPVRVGYAESCSGLAEYWPAIYGRGDLGYG